MSGRYIYKWNGVIKKNKRKLLPLNLSSKLKWIGQLFFAFSIGFSLTLTALANPTGGVVTSGNATISSPNPNQTIINQTSSSSIINWNSFNINKNQSTHFDQPTNGIALNRISPLQGASSIYGSLTATGQIILINPAGIYLGPTAFVNVGGLIVSTANITDQHFLNNIYQFSLIPGYSGSIVNQGQIIAASHGLIALVGGNVQNNGLIEANLGHIVLASGNTFTMEFAGTNLISFSVDEKTMQTGGITNTGTLRANGGTILVTAQVAQGVLDNAINMEGIVEAKSVRLKNGELILGNIDILGGSDSGVVSIAGKLNASGKQSGEIGGDISILGQNILVESSANLNTSGSNGGGNILIGGQVQGTNLLTPATHTFIASNVVINSNALTTGNGGQVDIWSNEGTVFNGSISSRGGSLAGNGGSVEVSSPINLQFNGQVDTNAPNGTMGTLLLDPKFLIVAALGGSTYINTANNLFNNNASGTSTITPSSIVLSNTNIILQANSDVIFEDALNLTGTGLSLTVEAGRSILIDSNISTNNGSIQMTANDTSAISTDRSTTNAGNPSGDNETQNANITMSPGTLLNSGTQNITLSIDASSTVPFSPGNITTRGIIAGNLSLISPNSITINGAILASNDVSAVSSDGSVVLNNSITAGGSGNAIVLAGGTFTNNVGAVALNPTNGNFLVWSGNPSNDNLNGLAFNFKQYDANFGSTTVLGTGNGLLYTIAPFITPILTGTVNKVYDTTTIATLANSNYSVSGTIDGDVITLNDPTTGSYNTKNVGINESVSVSGLSIMSAVNGSTNVYGYQLDSTTANANIGVITPATLSASLVGNVTKVYDTTTIAALTTRNYLLSGVLGNDVVSLNNPSIGNYDNQNAGTNKNVSISGLALSGPSQANYVLSATSINANIGLILPQNLTVTLTGTVSKVYNTTTTASLTSGNYILSGVLGNDVVNLNNPTNGIYDTANVGINKNVSVVGLAISGASASNYQLAANTVNDNVGIITPATLTVSLTGTVNKVYDTTTTASLTSGNYILSGVLGNDVVNLNNPTNGIYDTANVGINKNISVVGLAISGTSASNYQLAANTVNDNVGAITPATLTVSLTGTVSKVYDTTTIASLTSGNYILSGVLGSDVVNLNNPTNGTYDTANVGINKNVSVAGLTVHGTSAGNYQLADNTINGNIGIITPATLTVSLAGTVNKVYDTTTTASLTSGNYILSGVLGNDVVNLNNPTNGIYDTANVGINKNISVVGLAISGTSASNYQLAANTVNDNVGIITPATLTVSLTGTVNKVYDTTTIASLTSGNYILSGVLGSDVVNLNNPTNGTYDTANVGINKNVSVVGLTVHGTSAGNYQLADNTVNGNVGIITPATLTVSGVSANNKVFDTTTIATLNLGSAVLGGILTGDTLTINPNGYSANFISQNPRNTIGITVAHLGLSGASAANYTLIQPIGLTASIFPLSVPNTSSTPPPLTVPPGAVTPINSIPNISSTTSSGNTIANGVGSGVSGLSGITGLINTGQVIKVVALNNINTLEKSALDNIVQLPVTVSQNIAPSIVSAFRATILHYSLFLVSFAAMPFVFSEWKRKRREAFLLLSFKLRTALNGIIGFSNLIHTDKIGHASLEQKKYVDEILVGSNTILQELAKIETNHIRVPSSPMVFNLRTALNSIIGFAELIYQGKDNKTPLEEKEYFAYILNESNDILKLITH